LSSRNYAIPIWADGRTNDGDLNVYAAFIPLTTTTSVDRVLPVTSGVTLHDAVPNPAMDRTMVSFSLEQASSIHLALYDAAGRPVRFLTEQRYQPGTYNYTINLAALPSGMYFVRLESDMGYAVRRLTVTR
jgi:Secretion system C-terminal sorting domain